MTTHFRRALLALILTAGSPGLIAAQQADPPAAVPGQLELEAIFAEFQRVHMQLEGIQNEALRDPQLSAAQQELGTTIQSAMENVDPTMKERMARAMVLEAEAHAAQQTGDAERLEELVSEVETIELHFMRVQQQVVAEPAIAAKIMAFQTDLERKMIELNPEALDLINRFRELESVLQSATGGGA